MGTQFPNSTRQLNEAVGACWLISIDKNHARFLSSEAEAVVVQGDDARAAWLDHFDFNVLVKAHFVQAVDEGAVAIDFDDAGSFASSK